MSEGRGTETEYVISTAGEEAVRWRYTDIVKLADQLSAPTSCRTILGTVSLPISGRVRVGAFFDYKNMRFLLHFL